MLDLQALGQAVLNGITAAVILGFFMVGVIATLSYLGRK